VNRDRREAVWVLRTQADDRDALEQLLASLMPAVRRLAVGLVGEDAADDVVQETLLLVYRRLHQLADPRLVRPWTYRIAKRVGVRMLKKLRRTFEVGGEESGLDLLEAPPEAPDARSIDEFLRHGEVSPASRTVMLLHFGEGMSLLEVAAVLELPLGTVKSRLGYGLSILRRNLHEKEGQA